MGKEASKCAMWGGHLSHVFMYVRTYVRTYIRTCVTLRNAILVWPTHTLHVGPRVYYVHVCHSTPDDAEPELEGDGAIALGV